MVLVSGNEIIGGYTNGVSLKEIYTNGVLVWPTHPSVYYIQWTPEDLSGSFSMNGIYYNFQDYSGYFSDFSGSITALAFKNTEVSTIETNAIEVGYDAFRNCNSLTQASLSLCESVHEYVFAYCPSLTQVYLPKCEYLSNHAFTSCYSLVSVSLPVCKYIGYRAFENCYTLSEIVLPVCSVLSSWAFESCSSLSTITLLNSDVCTLDSSTVFRYAGITSIYVPASLVDSYKSAYGWTYFRNQIFGIS